MKPWLAAGDFLLRLRLLEVMVVVLSGRWFQADSWNCAPKREWRPIVK